RLEWPLTLSSCTASASRKVRIDRISVRIVLAKKKLRFVGNGPKHVIAFVGAASTWTGWQAELVTTREFVYVRADQLVESLGLPGDLHKSWRWCIRARHSQPAIRSRALRL